MGNFAEIKFAMKKFFVCAATALVAFVSGAYELPCTSPEAQGLESGAVMALIDSLMSMPQAELHNITVMRHGNIVAQASPAPFTPDMQHELFSVSKTFTGAAVGLAIDANRLRLDDRLGAVMPEILPDSVSPWLADVTVRDLLTMSSGMTVDWAMRGQEDHWAKVMASKPMVAEPGTKFAYDSMSTYLLSALVQKVMGRTVLDLLAEKVFTPLEITDYAWDVSPDGVTTGGWGLWMKPDGLARFGQMLLDGGRWQGQQILPENWVREMMTEKVDLPGDSDGYNYQMWKCGHKSASRADGAWGQFIVVMPEEDMVVVITQCERGVNARQLNLVWGLLSPATHDAPLAEGKDFKALSRRIATLAHPFPAGKSSARTQKALYGRTLDLPANSMEWKTLEVVPDTDAIKLITENMKGERDTLVCGYRRWMTSELNSFPPDERRDTHNRMSGHTNRFYTAGAYAWADGTLDVKLHFTHWYSSLSLKIKPAGDRFEVTMKLNYEGAPATFTATAE